MYLYKCPRCGTILRDVLEYDIVVEEYCDECGFSKSHGCCQSHDGVTSLVPYDAFDDCYEDGNDSSDCSQEDNVSSEILDGGMPF